MSETEAADKIEAFIREAFQIAPDDPGFGRSVDLFDAGYVDSVGVVETLSFIAESFGVEIPDEALLTDDFATIEGIARVVNDLVGRSVLSTVA